MTGRRPSAKTMRGRCDDVFSRIVRSVGRCEARVQHDRGAIDWHPVCVGRLECSHLRSRGIIPLRIDFDNAMSLCHGAHRTVTESPDRHTELGCLVKGDDIWDVLHARERQLREDPSHRYDWFADYEILIALEMGS